MKTKVSIIITTKNEEKNIGNCLESIKNQTYPSNSIEIIVVDNNSSDTTKEIAKKYTKNIFNFGPERSAQRNYGVKKAKGEYILYLDADMILSPTVVEKSVRKFKPSNIQYPVSDNRSPISHISYPISNIRLVALYIPEIILGNSYWSRVRRFERSFYDGTVIDCVRFIRKDIFEKVGGFDETMTGPEDWDLDKKIRNIGKTELLETKFKIPDTEYEKLDIGNKIQDMKNKISDIRYEILDTRDTKKNIEEIILSIKEPVIFHNEADFNLKKYLSKKNYYAKSFSTYINKWGKNDPDIKKQFGFRYRYIEVFTENNKWKKLFKYLNLYLGLFYLRILTGLILVFNIKHTNY